MTELVNMNKILLSFDLEEFDLPLEYKISLSNYEQFEYTYIGVKKVLDLLKNHKITTTFFTTASFASKYPQLLKQISKTHEIASHGLHHKIHKYNESETKKSKTIIEKIINKKIKGFRFPRLKKPNFLSLKKLGFSYDSSTTSAFLPPIYNNYFEKRNAHMQDNLLEIPVSTMPITHFPLSWIFFRFFPLFYSKTITLSCMKNPGFVNIYFHPWEFNNLNNFKIPFYIKRNSGKIAVDKLENYILWCKKKGYEFITFSEFAKSYFTHNL